MVLNPELVNVERVEGEITYSIGGQRIWTVGTFATSNMNQCPPTLGVLVHWNGLLGPSSVLLHMERMATDIASKGGIPWAVLKSPRKLNGTEAADLQTGMGSGGN